MFENIILLDERGEQLAQDLGKGSSFLHVNVTEESDVKAAIDYAVSKYGQLDCLFINAVLMGTSR